MSWFRETMLKAEAKADQFETWVKDSVTGATDRTREAADRTVADTNEFVDDYQNRSDSMLRRLPGYSGYKNKEAARDSDKALRDDIAQKLDQNATKVEAIQRTAANERNSGQVKELDPIVQGFRNLANVVRSSSYGYGGLFSDNPIDETALKQLRLFDEGVMVKVNVLTTAIDALENDSSLDSASIVKEIADIKASLALRGDVISEGRPVKAVKTIQPAPATEKAFDTGEKQATEPVELPEIDLGDAMSILGDDHIVQAMIDVDTGNSKQRFVRLDNTPQMWLWVSTDPKRTPKRLLGTDDSGEVAWDELTGRATISVPDERKRTSPGTIRTATDAGTNRVQLDIDGVVQNFTASEVDASDIETYRAR